MRFQNLGHDVWYFDILHGHLQNCPYNLSWYATSESTDGFLYKIRLEISEAAHIFVCCFVILKAKLWSIENLVVCLLSQQEFDVIGTDVITFISTIQGGFHQNLELNDLSHKCMLYESVECFILGWIWIDYKLGFHLIHLQE